MRDVLIAHGVPVWFSPKHILGGQQWQDEIGRSLKRCSWFLVLLTPYAVESIWVKRELNHAMRAKRYDGRILPLLFEPCDYETLNWVLPQFQMIDFTDKKKYDQACDELLRVWKKHL